MKKQIPIIKLLLSAILICISLNVFTQAPSQCTDVMLQGFYWDSYSDTRWTNLITQADEISESFDMVWLPPSGNAQNGGMGYLPIYYFDQNSTFGTQEELKALIAAFKENGTRTIADIVINHRNGKSNWTDFPSETYKGVTYTWGTEAICSDDEVKDQPGQAKPTGNPDTGENYEAGRDIDHTNENVRNTIKAYLDFMKNEMGYDGWRYDMTKGFHGRYIAEYNNDINAYFSVGEYFDGNYDLCWEWIKAAEYTSTTFDFPLKFQLNKAFNGDLTELVWAADYTTDQPAGLIHHSQSKRYSVTFVDNHDTGRDHNKFQGDILAANAFILSSPGVPCVWLSHWITYKEEIKPMIAARKAAGIHNESNVVVNAKSTNLYAATITGLYGKLFVKIGSGTYNAPEGFKLITSGNEYEIYTDVEVALPPRLTVSPERGTYIGGTQVTLTATNNAEIYYTLDESTPGVASARYSAPIPITQNNTLLKAIAIESNGKKSGIASHLYKTVANEPITIQWRNDQNWPGQMYLYAWDNADQSLLGEWPGIMIDTNNPDGWYSYTFTDRDYVNIIFNNGSNVYQTVDIKNILSNTCFGISAEKENNKYKYEIIDCTGSGTKELKTLFNLYPTIAENTIYINSENEITRISIYNCDGQLIKHINKPGSSIDVAELIAGVYFISVEIMEGKCMYDKFLKR